MEELKGTVRFVMTAYDPVVQRQFKSNDKPTNAVSFDPEMRWLATGGADSVVYVYSLKPQGRPYKFVGHRDAIHSVCFSPDGKIVASGGDDRTLRLWKNNIYGKCKQIKGHIGAIRSISFSQDSQIVVTSSDDKVIKGWSVPKRNFLFALPGHINWVRAAKLAPDSRLVVSGSDDCTVRVWDVSTSKELNRFKEASKYITSVDWITDGTTVCASSADGCVNLWDVRSMKIIQHYDVAKSIVNSLSVHPNGNYLATGDDDTHVKIFDLRAGKLGWLLYSHKDSVRDVAFNKVGDYFASCGTDGVSQIWKSNFDENLKRKLQFQYNYFLTAQNVVNFIQPDDEGLIEKRGSLQKIALGGKVTQTTFKANKEQQRFYPLTQSHIKENIPVNPNNVQQQYNPFKKYLSEYFAPHFERIVNQMDKITTLVQKLDERITTNENQIEQLQMHPKAIQLLNKYEQIYQEPAQKYTVWESFKSTLQESKNQFPQKMQQSQRSHQSEQEPHFDTGSFMRKELVEDYPDESDKKLQQEYELERQQHPEDYNNPFQSGALAGTSNFVNQLQGTLQQTFSTRQNLTEQFAGLGEWRQQLEDLQRELQGQPDELAIREEPIQNEDDDELFDAEPQDNPLIGLQFRRGDNEEQDDEEPQFGDGDQGNQGEEEANIQNQEQQGQQQDNFDDYDQ